MLIQVPILGGPLSGNSHILIGKIATSVAIQNPIKHMEASITLDDLVVDKKVSQDKNYAPHTVTQEKNLFLQELNL